jgi:hypothetical protein
MEILRPVSSVATSQPAAVSGQEWYPQLSVINEDLTLERKDSLLYNETLKETPSTKWNPDISFIPHSAERLIHYDDSSIYEEIEDASLLEAAFHTTNDISLVDSWTEDLGMNSAWSEDTTLETSSECAEVREDNNYYSYRHVIIFESFFAFSLLSSG